MIEAALVAALEEVTVANGYANNLGSAAGGGGAQLLKYEYNRRGVRPAALVILGDERYELQTDNMGAVCRHQFQVYLLGEPPANAEDVISTSLRGLVNDVKRRIGIETVKDLPLGVTGIVDLIYESVSYDEWNPEAIQAVIEGTVTYEHLIDDPEVPA